MSTTRRLGVIVPSTNVAVEDEYNQMRASGVSFHAGRITITNEALDGDDAFESFLVDLRTQISRAVQDVVSCRPDHLVMGMSAETFWGGAEGADEFQRGVEEESGLEVTTGAQACRAALELYGVRRIGVITPYQPVGDEQVRRFFADLGYEVAAVYGLRSPTATSIVDEPPGRIEAAFRAVDAPEIDALLQAGTNLQAVATAAKLEQELGKPVIAINAATLWHAYRTIGVTEQLAGFGDLLEHH